MKHSKPLSMWTRLCCALAFLLFVTSCHESNSGYPGIGKTVTIDIQPFAGISNDKIRYVASDELTCNQVAKILGEAIGKAELKWTLITEEETKNILISAGLNPVISAGLAEMQTSMHSGVFFEDYFKNRPALGATKMTTFAGEFAAAYHNS